MARSSPFASLPKFRRGSFGIFALTAVLSAFLSDRPIADQLLMRAADVLSLAEVWSPLTANFLFPDGGLGMLFGTLVVQWFVGSELEGFWGLRKYLLLVLGSALAGHLTLVVIALFSETAATTTVGGTTAIDLAAVAAFGVVFGKRPLRLLGALPLSSRGLAIGVIVLSLLGPIARGAPWPVVLPWLVAIGTALLVTTQPWRRMRDSGKLGGSKRKKKRQSHLRVVPPDPDLLN